MDNLVSSIYKATEFIESNLSRKIALDENCGCLLYIEIPLASGDECCCTPSVDGLCKGKKAGL